MFKTITDQDMCSFQQLRSSTQKKIRQELVEQYPNLAKYIDIIVPKKDKQVKFCKAIDHVEILVDLAGSHLFFRQREGPYFPSLKLVHLFPDIAPHVQVDRGAIKYVLNGANVMCPGLTSPGGNVPDDIECEQPVIITAEGKEHALAVGITKMSGTDIKTINKGIAIETVHYLGDGLWRAKALK